MPNPFVGSFPGLPEAEAELARTPPPNAPGVGFVGIPQLPEPEGGTVGGELDPIGLRALVDSLGAGAGRIGAAISDTVLPAFPPRTQTAMTDLAKTVAPLAPELTPAGDLTAAFKGAGDITGGALALDPRRMLRGAGELGLGMTAAAIPGASVGLLRRGADQAAGLARRVAPVAAAPVTSAKQALMDGVRRGVATRGGGRVEDVGVSTLLRDDAGNRIRVFHGSPHDFDRFDSTKIGTGEGAQAYGHGLYFAESEGVARSYRDALARRDRFKVDGKVADDAGGSSDAFRAALSGKSELEQYIKESKELAAEYWEKSKVDTLSPERRRELSAYGPVIPERKDFYIEQAQAYDRMAKAAEALRGKKVTLDKGHMFEVDILGRPEEFLDYDAPYDALSEPVKKAIKELFVERGGDPSNATPWKVSSDAQGSTVLGALEMSFGGPAQASEALRKAGIKGIRYKDAGSRAPAPTYKGVTAEKLDLADESTRDAVSNALSRMRINGVSASDALSGNREFLTRRVKDKGFTSAVRAEAKAELEALDRLEAKDFTLRPASSNFVVFDDSMLEIIRKYGLVLPGAAGAAGAAQAITDPGALGADQAGGA